MYILPYACCASIKAFVYNVGKAFPPTGESHPNKATDIKWPLPAWLICLALQLDHQFSHRIWIVLMVLQFSPGWRPSQTQPLEPTSSAFVQFNSVQSLSYVWLFATPWIAASQGSNSRSLPKLTSIKSVMPSSHLILCHPLLPLPQSFPASESSPMSQLFAGGGQSTGVSALASVLPMNIHDWSPLGWTGWISMQSKGLSRVFSNTTVQKHQFFSAQLSSQSNSHIHTWPLEKP